MKPPITAPSTPTTTSPSSAAPRAPPIASRRRAPTDQPERDPGRAMLTARLPIGCAPARSAPGRGRCWPAAPACARRSAAAPRPASRAAPCARWLRRASACAAAPRRDWPAPPAPAPPPSGVEPVQRARSSQRVGLGRQLRRSAHARPRSAGALELAALRSQASPASVMLTMRSSPALPRHDQPIPLQVLERFGSVAQPLDRAEHGDQVTLGQLPPARELLQHRALHRRVVHLARHRAQYTERSSSMSARPR